MVGDPRRAAGDGLTLSGTSFALDPVRVRQLAFVGATCASGVAGAIRWSGTAFEGCNGSTWVPLTTGGTNTCTTARASCRAHYLAGCTTSGNFTVDADGSGASPTLNAWCDMSGAGVTYAAFEQGSKRPLHHWDMESQTAGGQLRDLIGSYHLTVVGTPTPNATGAYGKTWQISATGQYFRNTTPTEASIGGANPRSISAWFFLSSYAGDGDNTVPIFGYQGGRNSTSFAMSIGGGGPLHFIGCSNDYNAGITPTLNVWHHGVVTYDGATVRLYMDGVLLGSQAKTLNTGAGSEPFKGYALGVDPWWSQAQHFMNQGRVDEAKVYDYVLTLAEVQALYQLNTEIRQD